MIVKRMLRIAVILSIIFYGSYLFANPKSDSIRIEELLTISFELIAENLDLAFETAEEALFLSVQLENNYLIAFSQYRKGHINRLLGNRIKSDSLIQLSLNGFKALNLPSFVAMVEIEIGNGFMYTMQLDSAEYYFLKALPRKIKAKDIEGEGIIYNNLGTIEDYRGNYTKALQLYQKAIPIYQLIGNAEMESNSYNNISIIQFNIGEINAAIRSAKNAAKINLEINHFYNLCMNEVCLANYYLELDKTDTAVFHASRSLVIADSLDFELGRLYALVAMGDVKFEQGNNELCLQYYNEFLDFFPQDGDPYMLAQVKHKMGLAYSDVKKLKLSIQMLYASLSTFEELGTVHELMSVNEALSKVYSEMGDFHRAYDHLETAKIYRDSFFNEEKAKEILVLERIYENEKKERQLVEKDLVIARRQKQNILLLIMLSLAGMGLILYWRKSQKEAQRAKLSEAIASKFELENTKVIEENRSINQALQELKGMEDNKPFIQNLLDKPVKLFDNLIYPLRDILYFESRDDAIYYFTVDKKYHVPTYGSLKRLAETTFVPPIFILVHRKHLVNIFNVTYFDPKSLNLHLKDETILKVARSKKKLVVESVHKYFSTIQ